MSRAEKLREIFKDIDEGRREIVEPLIEEAAFLEEQMLELKKHPFIRFNPKNDAQSKITAAGKQYREFLQTYTNIIDKLCRMYGKEEAAEESPLRAFLKGLEIR